MLGTTFDNIFGFIKPQGDILNRSWRLKKKKNPNPPKNYAHVSKTNKQSGWFLLCTGWRAGRGLNMQSGPVGSPRSTAGRPTHNRYGMEISDSFLLQICLLLWKPPGFAPDTWIPKNHPWKLKYTLLMLIPSIYAPLPGTPDYFQIMMYRVFF